MKKYQYFLFAFAALLFMGCKHREVTKTNKLQFIEKQLWEVTVPDHSDTVPQKLIDNMDAIFHCSAVRNGNFYGRNLDFFISDAGEIVVHTPKKGSRYASVGVGRMNNMTDAELEKGLTDEQLANLAWGMFDGINEEGLFCNMNVVHYGDGGDNPGTNPGKPNLYNGFLVRALLDNCATVDEAINFVNNHNIIGKQMSKFNLHFMIGDPQKTVILEFVDNKAVWVTDAVLPMIMTNFYISKLPQIHRHADGVERYNILKEHYDEAAQSVDAMYDLMKSVRYSLTYDTTNVPFWKSEYDDLGYSGYFASMEELMACQSVRDQIEHFAHFKKTGEYNRDWALWHTEHVSVYDIKNKTVTVTVNENYTPDGKHTFKL